jgi:uncharacterized Zn-finger protein
MNTEAEHTQGDLGVEDDYIDQDYIKQEPEDEYCSMPTNEDGCEYNHPPHLHIINPFGTSEVKYEGELAVYEHYITNQNTLPEIEHEHEELPGTSEGVENEHTEQGHGSCSEDGSDRSYTARSTGYGVLNQTESPPSHSKNSCPVCGKIFAKYKYVRYHMLTHKEKNRHICAVCDKGYSFLSTLKKHMVTHTGELPYPCSMCDRRFSQPSNLAGHLLTHTGEKPHVCPECGKCFALATNLTRHMVVHTGVKPHACAF